MSARLIQALKQKGVRQEDVAHLLGCTERTIRNKLSGRTEFTVREALLIRDEIFPDRSIGELFADSTERRQGHAGDQTKAPVF